MVGGDAQERGEMENGLSLMPRLTRDLLSEPQRSGLDFIGSSYWRKRKARE